MISSLDWTPFSYQDLSSWARNLRQILTESVPSLIETEKGGIIPAESLQAAVMALRTLRTKSPTWRVWSDLVTESVISTELQAAGAGGVILQSLCDAILGEKTQQGLRQRAEAVGALISQVSRSKRLIDEATFFEWLREFSQRHLSLSPKSDLVQAVEQAFRLSGPKTKIQVGIARGSSRWIVTSLRDSVWKFRVGLKVNGVLEPWTRSECRVCLIDGIVETVASLDLLLQDASQSRAPVLLVTRGLSEEVLATLVTNLHAGRLDILPVVLDPDSLVAVNALVDLSTCSGAKVVSSLTGDLLSSIRLDDLAVVARVQVLPTGGVSGGGEIQIEEPRRAAQVNAHLKYLYSRILTSSQNLPEITEVFEQRLASLTTDIVQVLLPGGSMTPTELGTTQTNLDTLLRTAKGVLTWGLEADRPRGSGMPLGAPIRGFDAPSGGRTCLASFLGLNASKSLLGALASMSGSLTEISGVP